MQREIAIEETDYYGLLEVDPSASEEVIRAAYKALVSKKDGLEAARKKALKILLKGDQRQEYDQQLINVFYGQNRIGNYQLLQKISEDGFSRTYSAKHLETEKLVWVIHAKKLSPRSIRILREEVIKSWDMRHPYVSAVRDFFKLPDGQYVIISSHIPGKSLDSYVRENGVITPRHIAWIVERCLNALSYLYDNVSIHGNINPKNIFLQPKHRAVLVRSNFAGVLPEMIGADEEYAQIFMPSEQIAGEKLWPESDLFSLGTSMIFGLTGDIEMVKTLKVPDIVPEPMSEFIRLMTKKNSQHRPRWEDGDVCEDFHQVRMQSFEADQCDMEPLPGLI